MVYKKGVWHFSQKYALAPTQKMYKCNLYIYMLIVIEEYVAISLIHCQFKTYVS